MIRNYCEVFLDSKEQVTESKVSRISGKFIPISFQDALSKTGCVLWTTGNGMYVLGKNAPSWEWKPIATLPAGMVFEYNRVLKQVRMLRSNLLLSVVSVHG